MSHSHQNDGVLGTRSWLRGRICSLIDSIVRSGTTGACRCVGVAYLSVPPQEGEARISSESPFTLQMLLRGAGNLAAAGGKCRIVSGGVRRRRGATGSAVVFFTIGQET